MPRYVFAVLALISTPAAADVVQATPAGFEVREVATVAAPVDRVWTTLVAPRLWWNHEHTYSDDAANLSLDERAGGCFCEKLPGKGSVEHLRVVYIQPPKALRLAGSLGPLQAEAANGTMAILLSADGPATKVTMSYIAGGYIRGGAERMAVKVDQVLAAQLAGLKAAVEGGAVAAPKRPGARPAPAPATPAATPDAKPLADVERTLSEIDAGPPAPPVPAPVSVPVPADSPR